jgi:hypothetical protein
MKTNLPPLAALVAFSSLFLAGPASAISITAGNVPQLDENVLLNSGTSGAIVQGTLNQSGALVNFSSASGDLTSPSSGQARIEPASGNDPFSSLTFWLADGTFTSAIFNVPGNVGAVDISVSFVNDGGAPFVTDFDTGNGSNFFTVLGLGDLLTSITVSTATGSFDDIRQIRIGGYAPATKVPDRGQSMLLLGIGLFAVSFCRFSDQQATSPLVSLP